MQPSTWMPMSRLADSARAPARELVYQRVLHSSQDGLYGASSGSRTPSVLLRVYLGESGRAGIDRCTAICCGDTKRKTYLNHCHCN